MYEVREEYPAVSERVDYIEIEIEADGLTMYLPHSGGAENVLSLSSDGGGYYGDTYAMKLSSEEWEQLCERVIDKLEERLG